ncbi:MAG: CAP domain-containing protein [Planctomycetes bacterium]|nr:CAP domain-containing protein [Planctomycetota bacterium]
MRPSRTFAAASILFVTTALLVPSRAASAQEPGTVGVDPSPDEVAPPPPTELPTSLLLSRLRSPRLGLAEAEQLVAALRLRPTRVRLQASDLLRAAYQKHEKAYVTAEQRVRERCERLAAKVQKDLLGDGGAARVAAAREAALAVTRSQGLSKEAIHRDIDPRMDELRELLMPAPEALLDADTDLRPTLDALRAEHTELRGFYAAYTGSLADMEGNTDVDKHLLKHPLLNGPGDAGAIDTMLLRAAFEGLPMSESDKKALAQNDELAAVMDPEEFDGTLQLNRIRYQLGLDLLRIDPKLGDAARDHAKDMATLGFFSHQSPVAGKESFGKRAANFGTSAGAENIAAGQGTGRGAIRAWWYSPGHHKNMLAGHRRTGLGRHEQLWTQMFGG